MDFKFLNFSRNIERFERIARTRGALWRFLVPLLESRYFVVASGIYIVLLLVLGPIAVSKYEAIRGSFDDSQTGLILPPPGEPPPPTYKPSQTSTGSKSANNTAEVAVKAAAVGAAVASSKNNAARRFTTTAPSPYVQAATPTVAPQPVMDNVTVGADIIGKGIAEAEVKRLTGVRDFQSGWGVSTVGGQGPLGGRWTAADYKKIKAKFTVYEAKYQDGDWHCNPSALFNMLIQIRAWSKDRIDAKMLPEVLDVGTDQIFTLKPPFIYLTGHKDFHFLDKEVTNLRDYLMLGGAVWADSALVGRRSRFDVAFRREIKRVLPDRDFEEVPEDHVVFNTFFENIGLPSGMNYYQEPLEMIKIGDEMAVLYSLNGYGHFWESRLDKNGKINWGQVNITKEQIELGILSVTNKAKYKPSWQYVYGPHLGGTESSIIYRNINDDTVRNAYKFGINVVVHLLTRYQHKLQFLPKEMKAATEFHGRPQPKEKEEVEETPSGKDDTKPKPRTVGNRGHRTLGGALMTNTPPAKAGEAEK